MFNFSTLPFCLQCHMRLKIKIRVSFSNLYFPPNQADVTQTSGSKYLQLIRQYLFFSRYCCGGNLGFQREYLTNLLKTAIVREHQLLATKCYPEMILNYILITLEEKSCIL